MISQGPSPSSSVVRLLTVSLKTKNRLALFVGERFRRTFHQSCKNTLQRLGYLGGLEVAGATRGSEGPTWEPKTPRQDWGDDNDGDPRIVLVGVSFDLFGREDTKKKQWLHIFVLACDLAL
jgi:hypothetical protein